MGSVKDKITPENFDANSVVEVAAARAYMAPTDHEFGQGVWRVSGRFSVADLKGDIPQIEIPGKAEALAMTAGYFWENLPGITTCYVGMMDLDGKIVTVSDLIQRGDRSNYIVMNLANTPRGKTQQDLDNYHEAIQRGDISLYVADAETIFRKGFPLGSSSFKGMFRAARVEEMYESLATFDEVVGGLEEIRRRRNVEYGKIQDHESHNVEPWVLDLNLYLRSMGLSEVPNPGFIMDKYIIGYTSKFSIGGDKDLNRAQAQLNMHLNDEIFAIWEAMVDGCVQYQIGFCQERGIVNIDGKVEGIITPRGPIMADFACTPDENRLMIVYQQGGINYLIPANKEIQRAIFRAHGVYTARDQLIAEYGDQWSQHLDSDTRAAIDEATHESIALMSDAIKVVANRMFKKDVFCARPIEQWVEPFLPYASRVQPGQEEMVGLK